MKKTFRLAAMLLLACMCSGCTAVLWETDHFTSHRYPAPDPKLVVLHDVQQNDFIACYDELNDKKGTVQRRAYSVRSSADAVERGKKPRHLAQVPPNLPTIEINPADRTPPYVLVTNTQFTIYTVDESIAGRLPTYRNDREVAMKLALTPLTLVADAAIVGLIAALMCPDCVAAAANAHH